MRGVVAEARKGCGKCEGGEARVRSRSQRERGERITRHELRNTLISRAGERACVRISRGWYRTFRMCGRRGERARTAAMGTACVEVSRNSTPQGCIFPPRPTLPVLYEQSRQGKSKETALYCRCKVAQTCPAQASTTSCRRARPQASTPSELLLHARH